MGLFGANLMLRQCRRPPTGALPMLLSLVGNAGLFVSAWYGGKLVYEPGMRVKPLMEGEQPPELKPPGDEKLEEAFQNLQKEFA
jgi:hypothetical protein